MTVERSVGSIIFREENHKNFYLLLHYASGKSGRRVNSGEAPVSKDGHWDFSKGHIEKGETTETALRREVKEETGIEDLKIIQGFKETIRYFYIWEGVRRLKYVAYFICEIKTKDIKISFEHIGYVWLPYEEALERIAFENSKELLKKANDFLME